MTGALPAIVIDADVVSDVFSSAQRPVARVALGDRFAVHTRSILTHVPPNQVGDFADLGEYGHLNIPVTGPIEVAGVHAGDVLRVDIHEVRIAELGAMITLPGRGGFTHRLRSAGRVLPIVDGEVMFAGVALPVRPMVGKIGVGTPESPHCSTVGAHGGNMDCTQIGPGASLFLPVREDGGLLFVGDLHARQADGEASLTGVEVEGTVVASCHVVPGVTLRRPLLVSAGRLVTVGDGDDLDEAVRVALDDMLAIVRDTHRWSPEEAAMFISVAGDIGVCQVVNARRSATVAIPTEWCPAAPFVVPA